jgi:hypothetical protein
MIDDGTGTDLDLDGGYRAFVAGGIGRLRERIDAAPSVGRSNVAC